MVLVLEIEQVVLAEEDIVLDLRTFGEAVSPTPELTPSWI